MALVLALAAGACGKVNTFHDAGGDDDDTAIDANTTTTLTVTTYSRTGQRAIVSGVDVVVVAADGTVRDQGITDADGHATLDARDGDSVTAVYREVGGAEIVTYLAVRPGDEISFGRDGYFDEPSNATMTVTWPDVAANQYRIYHPCGTTYEYAPSDLTATIEQRPSCAVDTFDLFLTAFDSNGVLIRSGKIAGTTFVDTESRPLQQWQNPTAFTLTAVGLPEEVTSAQLEATPTVNGRRSYSVSASGTPTDGEFAQTVAWGATGGPVLALGLFRRNGGFGQQGILEPIAANATQWQAQNAITLPWIGPVIANAAAREVSWISEGEGTYDATVVFIDWERTETDGGIVETRWFFIGPPGITSIEIPELPGTLAQYAPRDTDSIDQQQVVLFDVVADDGFEQIRARPEWEVLGLFGDTLPPGALKISTSPFN
jgi:hypothetical protein